MTESHHQDDARRLTESQVATALALDRLELYLLAAELRLGRYDPLTHLLVFTAAEAEHMATRLGLPRPKFAEELAGSLERVPEPSGE